MAVRIPEETDLEGLYRDTFEYLVRYTRRRVGNHQEAEDIAQDVFLRLIDSGLVGIEAPKAYATRIAGRSIISRHRRNAAHHRMIANYASAKEATDEAADPCQPYERGESLQLLQEAIDSLSERHKEILHLHLADQGPKQIAEVLKSRYGRSFTANQVSALLKRIRQHLATWLRRHEFLPSIVPLFGSLRYRLRRWADLLMGPYGLSLQQAVVAALIVSAGIVGPQIASNHLTGSHPPVMPADIADHDSPTLDPHENNAHVFASHDTAPPDDFSWELPAEQGTVSKREQRSDPSPSLQDQLLGMIEDPGTVPLPECGGFTLPVCQS